jgi:hypothetical protein
LGFLAHLTSIAHLLGEAIEIQGLPITIPARFRHIFEPFRQKIGRFDPLFDTIMAPGDPFLARFSVPNRRLIGRKECRIPSLVEKTVLAGLLASDLL